MAGNFSTPNVKEYFLNLSVSEWLEISLPARILLIIFTFLIVLCGVCGNGLVLFLMMKYNALKMDKISVVFLKNLAAADIASSCGFSLKLLTLISDRWILGKSMCIYVGYLDSLPTVAAVLLTTSITCHRLRVLSKPLRSAMIRIKTGYIVAGGIWAAALVYMILVIIRIPISFHPMCLTCVSVFHGEGQGSGFVLDTFFYFILSRLFPMLITVVGNAWMLFIVARSSGRVGERALPGRQAIITTSLVSGCFVLSMTPWIIVHILSTFDAMENLSWKQWVLLALFHQYCASLNVVVNPFIYYFRNTNFRNIVRKIVLPGSMTIVAENNTVEFDCSLEMN